MKNDLAILQQKAITLLKSLIATPSFSKDEATTAAIIAGFLEQEHISCTRTANNILARNKHFDAAKPTILLNSHHDTVKPNKGYTLDPFTPLEKEGKLYGLGSNDAGGCLVSLLATFVYFYETPGLPFNLVMAATAEEEISGTGGVELILSELPPIFAAIVGEPTLMNLAVAERGLMVLDCTAQGQAGHAAREEGENAIYKAMTDIEWFRNFRFPKVSPLLGPVKMNVTVVETENRQHNVVPAQCKFVVDVRVNECYTFEEVLQEIEQHVQAAIQPRSTRLRSSSIPLEHPLVQAGISLGRTYYGSPTTSDKALMPFPALKMGPGDSARSHTADEFIFIREIQDGVKGYIELLTGAGKLL